MTLFYLVDGAVIALVVALLVKEHPMPSFPVQVDPPPQSVTVDQPPQSMTLTLDNNDVARVLRVVGRAATDMDTACAIACSEAGSRR
ncbi:MAG TPA: hypothetical protein VFJ22_12800 [Dermatophilaceae bacterium]|nr:hypothetical protein [Dermatophilaceae bacterium]